jgi:outer membrane receptor protein involved in Fe transport
MEKNLNAFGKIDYILTPVFKIGAQVLISHRDWRDYEFNWRFDLGGLPPEERTSNRVAAIVSHTVSDNFFYTASLSRYVVDSRIGRGAKAEVPTNDPWQYDFFLRYIVSGERAWWLNSSQRTYTAKLDGTVKLAPVNMMKFGGEFNYFDLNSDLLKYEPRTTYFGKPLINEPLLDFSSAYSYQPWTAALYIQDKIDLLDEGALLNFGLRYDILNPRASRPAIESIPLTDTAYSYGSPQNVSASIKQQLSPRIGAAMQVAEHGYLFVNLGYYFQYPLFDYLYTGLDRAALAKGFSAVTGNPDLNPERSQSLEISLKYTLPADMVASLTYFRKETSNQVDTKTFISGAGRLGGNLGYAEFVNNPYAEASGFELVLTRDRGSVLTGEFSYTYMFAEGTSGSAYQGLYSAQYGLPTPLGTYPLSWDQRHALKLLATLSVPSDLDLNLVVQWHSGRPYTYYPIANPFAPVDSSLFAPNNRRMPSFFNVDLKVQKHFTFSWWPAGVLTLYADIRNVTNAKNVQWIDSNGSIGGELNDPSGYFIGRRTHVGFHISF